MYGLFCRYEESHGDECLEYYLHFVRYDVFIDCRGTLAPMTPLVNEFQIPIQYMLENMHVISESQVCIIHSNDE